MFEIMSEIHMNLSILSGTWLRKGFYFLAGSDVQTGFSDCINWIVFLVNIPNRNETFIHIQPFPVLSVSSID